MYKFGGVLVILVSSITTIYAQSPSNEDNDTASGKTFLPGITVSTSADASAEGLSPPYAGGQVARGGKGWYSRYERQYGYTVLDYQLYQ